MVERLLDFRIQKAIQQGHGETLHGHGSSRGIQSEIEIKFKMSNCRKKEQSGMLKKFKRH